MSLQVYVSFPYENNIWYEYDHLVHESFNSKSIFFPFVGALLANGCEQINLVARQEKINEAIKQGLHRKYGYESHVFTSYASMGRIAEFQYTEIPKEETDRIILGFLRTRFISHTDQNFKIINSPFGGGIW